MLKNNKMFAPRTKTNVRVFGNCGEETLEVVLTSGGGTAGAGASFVALLPAALLAVGESD